MIEKKIHLPKLINVELLFNHPQNPQEQSSHTFTELRESIAKGGFDEPLIVYPRDDFGYWIISGNHRFLAGKAEGYTELPCIVRSDWTKVKAELEVARRNLIKGKFDSKKFTAYVDAISSTYDIPLDAIYEGMGFENAADFAALYKKEQEKEIKIAQEVAKTQEVKLIDNLGALLTDIFNKYGHTVPSSFIIFPMGGKKHMYVECTPALKNAIEAIAMRCVAEGVDINVALGGLLKIGLKHSNFLMQGSQEVVDEGTEDGDSTLNSV